MSNKIVKLCAALIAIISMITFFSYFTRPKMLDELIDIEAIKEIKIYTNIPHNFNKTSGLLVIDDNNDIDEIINILNSYKYSKKFILKNLTLIEPSTIKAETNLFVQMFIIYRTPQNQYEEQDLIVYSNNKVAISNARRIRIEYSASSGDKGVFHELSSCLKSITEEGIYRF